MSLIRRHIGRTVGIAAVLTVSCAVLVTTFTRTGRVPAYAIPTPQASTGALPNSGSVSARSQPGTAMPAAGPVDVRYTFDGGVQEPITDTSGGHELRALGQNGGFLSLVPGASGLALAFPQRCTLARERDCPRAILEGQPDDDSLNPGTLPLRYGASILMTRTDLADGANVLQKGYSVGGVSEFKLQVDHLAGHPSCVIAGNSERIYRAEPSVNVADGHWHDLACVRDATSLTLMVDNVPLASVAVPEKLSIVNPEPLRIGGKGAAKGNDQYAGQIDNVFIQID